MDAARYLVLVRRWWWLVAVGTIIAVAAYGVAARVRGRDTAAPVYAASATLLVELTGDRATAGSPEVATRPADELDRLVATYAALIRRRAVTGRAAGVLGIANDHDDITNRITTESLGGTQLLQITVEAASPEDAELLTGAIVRAFTEVHREQSLPGTFSLYETAPAIEQPRDSRPEALTMVLVALAGALAASAVVFAFEYLSDAVRDAADAEHVAGVPVLASVPLWRTSAGLAATASPTSAAERYRMLRTAIRLKAGQALPKTMLVTGTRAGAGATTTAVNYAVALAQAGRRVVLVDADMRAPAAQRAFGIGGYTGLADILTSDRVPLDAFLRPTGVDGLTLLPAGDSPQWPSELLDSPRFDAVLSELRARFDAIVFDSPPVLDATDAAVLASKSDAAILVVRCDLTARVDVAASVQALDRSAPNVLGVVLNADPASRSGGFVRLRARGESHVRAEARLR